MNLATDQIGKEDSLQRTHYTRSQRQKPVLSVWQLGGHRHEDCSRVDNKDKRKELLRKYSRCLNCLRKGHFARNCNIKVVCSVCKGEHHTSLCDQGKVPESKPKGQETVGEEGEVSTTLILSPKDSIVNMCSSKVGQKSGRARYCWTQGIRGRL